jgi:hypothetical protein
MAIRQTRIYAPTTLPYDSQFWAETMMERIIKPIVASQDGLVWFWFTRYASLQPEFADSDESKVPTGFFGNMLCRSLRFRFEVADDALNVFEANGSKLITQEGCWTADWRDYGIGELCSNRFLGENRSQTRRDERLILVKDYLASVSRLALHSLVPEDNQGRFRFEANDDPQNLHDSAFFSLHHLFCNTTDVLLTALINCQPPNLQGGTWQNPPPDFVQNQQHPCSEFQVRF